MWEKINLKNNQESNLKNNENINFLSVIKTEELFEILDYINFDYKDFLREYNFDNENKNPINLDYLKAKKPLELFSILKQNKENNDIFELEKIFKKPEFANIYKQLLDYNPENHFLEALKIYIFYFSVNQSKEYLNVDWKINYLIKKRNFVKSRV